MGVARGGLRNLPDRFIRIGFVNRVVTSFVSLRSDEELLFAAFVGPRRNRIESVRWVLHFSPAQTLWDRELG